MPPLAAVPDLESELDELFGLPLEEFTRARNDLAQRLKRAHQAEAASEVRRLKKPTVVAWAANRLAREEAERVGALLAAAGELREVQQRSLADQAGIDEVGEAIAAERDAVRALVSAARTRLGGRVTPALLDRLGQTLRAAAADHATRAQLERGRLTDEVQAAGFGGLEPVARPARRRDELAKAARERVTVLRAEVKRLAEDAVAAEHAAAEAERSAATLRAEAEQKREESERAAAELAEAEADLKARR